MEASLSLTVKFSSGTVRALCSTVLLVIEMMKMQLGAQNTVPSLEQEIPPR